MKLLFNWARGQTDIGILTVGSRSGLKLFMYSLTVMSSTGCQAVSNIEYNYLGVYDFLRNTRQYETYLKKRQRTA